MLSKVVRRAVGRRAVALSDAFQRADTTSGLGSIPNNGPLWELISGAWKILSNRAHSDTSGPYNPIAAVETNSSDGDVESSVSGNGGDCIYARVVDASNWLRVRTRRWTTTSKTYKTEYEWKVTYRYSFTEYEWRQYYKTSDAWKGTSKEHGHYRYFWGTSSSVSVPDGYNHTHSDFQHNMYKSGSSTKTGNTRTNTHDHIHYYWGSYTDSGAPSSYSHSHGSYGTHTMSKVSASKTGNTRQVESGTTTTTHRRIYLEKAVAGTITSLGYGSGTSAPTLRLRMNGSALQVYRSGTSIISATSSDHMAATKHGVGKGPSDLYGHAINNFSYTPL